MAALVELLMGLGCSDEIFIVFQVLDIDFLLFNHIVLAAYYMLVPTLLSELLMRFQMMADFLLSQKVLLFPPPIYDLFKLHQLSKGQLNPFVLVIVRKILQLSFEF